MLSSIVAVQVKSQMCNEIVLTYAFIRAWELRHFLHCQSGKETGPKRHTSPHFVANSGSEEDG